jgi:hypothetical protein
MAIPERHSADSTYADDSDLAEETGAIFGLSGPRNKNLSPNITNLLQIAYGVRV